MKETIFKILGIIVAGGFGLLIVFSGLNEYKTTTEDCKNRCQELGYEYDRYDGGNMVAKRESCMCDTGTYKVNIYE